MTAEKQPELAEVARDARSTAEALERLREVGASPVQAIKALVEGRELSLKEAKFALARSPSWQAETRAADRLHQALIDVLGLEENDLDTQ